MKKMKVKNNPAALERLSNAQNAIEEYSASHPCDFSESERLEFRELLKERAAALSEATGMVIHSVADNNE